MSNKDRIISLLDNIPDYKMGYILAYVQGITADISVVEEVEPDEWDLQMIKEAEEINDDTVITLDELAKELNINV